jgi:hypothetical protein
VSEIETVVKVRMMKKIVWLAIFILSGKLYAADEIQWQHVGDDKLSNKFNPSLTVAKEWANKYYEKKQNINKFNYFVAEYAKGFYLMVMPIYVDSNGRILPAVMDSQMCVFTNKEHKFVEARLCNRP